MMSTARPKVFVIDDDPELRPGLSALLQSAGA
jgi:FixJ family two-component response regulator